MSFKSLAPTQPPLNVNLSVISRNVSVSWSPIDCVERNGLITLYIVEFLPVGGNVTTESVPKESFTASDLMPSTNYSFRVAGVNSHGIGPFSAAILFATKGM